eukprot:scaffold11082_cov66-Cylindrotheca_fusiformis.AAC.1
MGQVNSTMTFERAMGTFRNAVNAEIRKRQAFVPRARGRRGQAVRISQVGSEDSQTTREQLSDGTTIDYHPGKFYSPQIIKKFPQELYERMMRQRKEYKGGLVARRRRVARKVEGRTPRSRRPR